MNTYWLQTVSQALTICFIHLHYTLKVSCEGGMVFIPILQECLREITDLALHTPAEWWNLSEAYFPAHYYILGGLFSIMQCYSPATSPCASSLSSSPCLRTCQHASTVHSPGLRMYCYIITFSAGHAINLLMVFFFFFLQSVPALEWSLTLFILDLAESVQILRTVRVCFNILIFSLSLLKEPCWDIIHISFNWPI